MKRLLVLSIFLAACPAQVGEQCPPHTVSMGEFNLFFQGQHPANECTVTVDGGATPLVLADGGTRGATICYGTGADGGAQLQLVIPTKGARVSDLLPDGGFNFGGASANVVGTACDPVDGGACPITINETFAGNLLVAGDAGFAVLPDGGLPQVTFITGSLVDALTTTDNSHCVCNVPCSVTYGITGTPF